MSCSDLTVLNGTIFNSRTCEQSQASIRVVGGQIVDVGKRITPGEQIIDASGRSVLPGLIDGHFHAYGAAVDSLQLEAGHTSYFAIAGARRLERALRRGITTVRDVAGGDRGLRAALDTHLVRGPRYLFTGPALSQTGGHGDCRPADLDICVHGSHMTEVVDGVESVRRVARERFRRGAHAIKLMTSGGVVSPTDPLGPAQYSADEIRAATEEANRRGSYVAAHAYSAEAVRHSLENGVRSIEHGNLLDAVTARLMTEHGAFLVPTLIAYDAMDRRGDEVGLPEISRSKNREVLNAGKQAIEHAVAAGTRIGWGSDLMGDLESDQLHGLRLQSEVTGISAALQSATKVNADLIGRPDLGVIEPGGVGDLLILDGNALDEPAVVWEEDRPRTIIQAGRVAA